ncbi:MAG: RIO1 family regulatory kinase/ATPase [Halanaeroarchaeum sp.]
MDIRRLLRGTLDWPELESVAEALLRRYDRDAIRITFLDAENWLSTPLVVDDAWFVKVITQQNAVVHALFTSARNLGAFTAGGEGFFEHSAGPVEMVEHELEATERMVELGLNAPEPVEAFEVDGLGVLVMEYLADFRTLDALSATAVEEHADAVFAILSTMHQNGLAHGDLREENVLVADGDLYFIDATRVDTDAIEAARAYDVASALAALEPHVGAERAVDAAGASYPDRVLGEAVTFLGFVNLRPDHDFDAAAVTRAIEARADAAGHND